MKLINGNYSSRNAGRIYDTLRFSGLGGKTINDMEKDIILKAISEGLKEDGVMGDLGAGTGRFSLHILKMCRENSVKHFVRLYQKFWENKVNTFTKYLQSLDLHGIQLKFLEFIEYVTPIMQSTCTLS